MTVEQRYRWLYSLVAGVCILATPARAHAENEEQSAYAERLFQHGVELMKRDSCESAIPEFLSSQQLDPSAATLVNLATCYARLGRKATAWKTYRQAAALAASEKNDELRARAFQAMSLLSPTLTKLRIVASNPSAALSVKLNGEVLKGYDALPVPLDPGENIIEAVAPGHEAWRRSVTANEVGATLVVEVPELRPVIVPDRGPDLRTPGIIICGAGAAAIVVGSILGISASQAYDESSAFCKGDRCTAQGVELREDALDKALLSTYTISLGAVAAATGVVLWVVSPKSSGPSVGAVPWVHAGTETLGVAVQGKL